MAHPGPTRLARRLADGCVEYINTCYPDYRDDSHRFKSFRKVCGSEAQRLYRQGEHEALHFFYIYVTYVDTTYPPGQLWVEAEELDNEWRDWT